MACFGAPPSSLPQFSITIISAMLLSVVVALILTPVLCASLLKPVGKGHEAAEGGIPFLRPFFRWFNGLFFRSRERYLKEVARALSARKRYLAGFVLIVAAFVFLFQRMPTSYLPDEDQGMMMVQAMLPANTPMELTEGVMTRIRDHLLTNEPETVESVMNVAGISFAGRGQNMGMAFVRLRDWDLRDRADLKVDALAGRSMRMFSQYRDAMVFAFPPPSVIELGNARGFDFQLLDRGGVGHEKLMEARNMLLGMAARDPRLRNVRPNGMEDTPQYRVDVDWGKVGAQSLPIKLVHSTISAAFGSAYVNDFIQAGRVKRVYVQADAPYRMLPKDVDKLYVRNSSGKMVPFSAFAKGRWTSGSPKLERFNGFPSINIQGEPAEGRSSGEAMAAMEEIASKLPQGIGFDWTGLSYQERLSGSRRAAVRFFRPRDLPVPCRALRELADPDLDPHGAAARAIGGVIATSLKGMPNDVYFQIGLLTTLGLTTKNAILIVQFAKIRVEEGMGLIEATLEASKLRLRPIVMTSLAFGFGVLPLAIASGAGAGAQRGIGVGVIGGVVTATFLVTLFAPLFYVLIYSLSGKHRKQEAARLAEAKATGSGEPNND
jgi:HAE1 family hydrophobic/amphiphilic exporter-1